MTIEFADGTSAPGTVLATDTVTDLAVVRSARGGLLCPSTPGTSPPTSGPAVLHQQVTLTLVRQGERRDVPVTVGAVSGGA